MSSLWMKIVSWWSGGDVLMPVMLCIAATLYLLIGERLWALFGPAARIAHRRDELERILDSSQTTNGDPGWRDWIARYVALAEEGELSRGFTLIRTLTAMLPLLGLLGTVSGMIATFGALGEDHGTAAFAHQSSAGIGLALTATQYGMALAVPAVVLEWCLRRRVDTLVHRREVITRAPRKAGSDATMPAHHLKATS
jgi:biopolymer transport protein ExbB/TolQ